MTEAEWLDSQDLTTMLATIQRSKAHRKLRLFACACCREVWEYFIDSRRKAVEVAEEHADGLRTVSRLEKCRIEAVQANEDLRGVEVVRAHFTVNAAFNVTCASGDEQFYGCILDATGNARCCGSCVEIQGELLHDIFGNPFQPVSFDPSWRTTTAIAIAKGMYESRDFAAMPLLEDALEDAAAPTTASSTTAAAPART